MWPWVWWPRPRQQVLLVVKNYYFIFIFFLLWWTRVWHQVLFEVVGLASTSAREEEPERDISLYGTTRMYPPLLGRRRLKLNSSHQLWVCSIGLGGFMVMFLTGTQNRCQTQSRCQIRKRYHWSRTLLKKLAVFLTGINHSSRLYLQKNISGKKLWPHCTLTLLQSSFP